MLNDKLYVIGGAIYKPNSEGTLGDAIATVNMYDLKTRRWIEMAPMNSARAYLSVSGKLKNYLLDLALTKIHSSY